LNSKDGPECGRVGHFRAKGGARAIIQALSSAKECVKNKSENAWQQRIGGAATRASSLQS
jgi:hypothetical protein